MTVKSFLVLKSSRKSVRFINLSMTIQETGEKVKKI